jgi:hypothetical protein
VFGRGIEGCGVVVCEVEDGAESSEKKDFGCGAQGEEGGEIRVVKGLRKKKHNSKQASYEHN